MNNLEVTKKEINKLVKKNELGKFTMGKKHIENKTAVLNIFGDDYETLKMKLSKAKKVLSNYNLIIEPSKEIHYRGGELDGQLCYVEQTIRFKF